MRASMLFVVALSMGACLAQSPTDDGPYDVGCRMRTIERPSDTDTTTRTMDIYVWYPADPILFYWVDAVEAFWNERPMQGDTARPVLFFSHGGCGHPLASVYFTSFMASWGFIVISTMHPGSMYGDSACLDSASLHDTWLNRPGDVDFTRRHFIDLSADSSNLFGVFDTMRMGMSGHSFGARTTYAMLNRTDYFVCGLAFSGNYIDRWGSGMYCMDDVRGVLQPIMIQNGTYDIGLPSSYAAEIYDTLESPKYWVEIHRVEHFQWGDTCDSVLDPLCGADSILDYPTAHHEILKYSVPFLMHYLMGDNRFDDYLTDTSDTFVTLSFDETTEISESRLPANIELTVFPNPFNSAVSISAPDNAIVEIFDLNGRIIADLSANNPVGSRQASTAGDAGVALTNSEYIWTPDKSVGSGVYLVRAKIGDKNIAKRIVYLK